ncbi:MAG TPA: hypothetical protein VF718_07640 [Allosphingosinicella sp.]|jgi:hypothetical protein
MEAISPVFAALGVTGCDALDDLAHWLDGAVEPAAGAETPGWARNLGELARRAAFAAAGREG